MRTQRIKLIALGILTSILALACQSATPVLGFATAAYVDAKLADAEAVSQAELGVLSDELSSFSAKIEKLDTLLDDVDQFLADNQATKDKIETLEGLAALVERRLESMPRETIKAIVDILQDHLGAAAVE